MILAYSIAPNGGLCFARLDRAIEISRIHEALKSSKTWADFERAMPAKEYARIVGDLDGHWDENEDDIVRPEERPFTSDSVPGVGDGDYPPWLQPEMSGVLPESVLERFGTATSTVLNGTYYHFRQEDLEAILAMLRGLGHEVHRREDLTFW